MIDPQLLHKCARWFYQAKIPMMPGFIQRINLLITGCDLPASVLVGKNVRFPHYGRGVIVHHKVTIGDNVVLMPHVVIGQAATSHGVFPLEKISIGNNVLLGAGCVIIATDTLEIGAGTTVGALSLVLKSLPPGVLAVGAPVRIMNYSKTTAIRPWELQPK